MPEHHWKQQGVEERLLVGEKVFYFSVAMEHELNPEFT